VTRTRAAKISDTVLFKHQYITSPTISPESHVVAAAQQLVMALQGNILTDNKMVEDLTRVSELFTKLALAKKAVTKAKEQRNRLGANPLAQITTRLTRVAVPPPRVDVPLPRVTEVTQADRRVSQIFCKHARDAASWTGPCNMFPFTVTMGQRAPFRSPAKLHLAGQRGQQSPSQMTIHKVSSMEHNAGSHVGMH
jgi:hypothetical protein